MLILVEELEELNYRKVIYLLFLGNPMVRRRYSARARAGTRNPMDLRISFIKDNITSLEAEKKKYSKYLGRGLNDSFIRKAIRNINNSISIRKRQLARYQARRIDYKKRGLI